MSDVGDQQSRIRALQSLKSTIQSVDSIHEAVESPVKLFVMISSLLSEYCSSPPSLRTSDVDLILTALSLLQDTIPIIKSDAPLLFGCCLSSVISCFCSPDLSDEVCRIVFMYVEFYGLQPFLLHDLVEGGMEHDDEQVRLMCLKVVPRLLKNLPMKAGGGKGGGRGAAAPNEATNPPAAYCLLLTGCVGRLRDVSDRVVQASIEVLAGMAAEDAKMFESGREEMDDLHKELVKYYEEQIYGGDINWTPRIWDDKTTNSTAAGGKSKSQLQRPQASTFAPSSSTSFPSSPSRPVPKVPPLSMPRTTAAPAPAPLPRPSGAAADDEYDADLVSDADEHDYGGGGDSDDDDDGDVQVQGGRGAAAPKAMNGTNTNTNNKYGNSKGAQSDNKGFSNGGDKSSFGSPNPSKLDRTSGTSVISSNLNVNNTSKTSSKSALLRVQSFGEMPPFLSSALNKSFSGLGLEEEDPYVPSWQSPEPSNGHANKTTAGNAALSLGVVGVGGGSFSSSPAGAKLKRGGFVPPSVDVDAERYDAGDDEIQPGGGHPHRYNASGAGGGGTSPNREDQLSAIKKRQESRRAARRALSANNADERRVREARNPGDNRVNIGHGPGTPIAVGKYAPDGIRTNFETHELQHSPLAVGLRPAAPETGENRPIRPSNRRSSDEATPSKFDDELLLDETAEISGKKQTKAVSLATRRRMERSEKEQQQMAEMELLDSQLSSPPAANRVNKGRAAQISPRGAGNDMGETWAKDARTTISFQGKEQELQKILGGVGVDEWPEVFHSLNSIRRLSLHHSAILEAHVHAVFRTVLKAVDNLRSAVAKNAILTIADMWRGMGRSMDPELITVVPVLLKRFGEVNGFLIEVADDAISTIIAHATDTRALAAFMASAGTKVPSIREKSAAVTLQIIAQMDAQKLASCREFEKLLSVVPMWCQDRQSETRVCGRQIAAFLLMHNIVDDAKMQNILPPEVYSKVEQSMANGMYHTPLKRAGGLGGPGLGGGVSGYTAPVSVVGGVRLPAPHPSRVAGASGGLASLLERSQQHTADQDDRGMGGGQKQAQAQETKPTRQRATSSSDDGAETSLSRAGAGAAKGASQGGRKDGLAANGSAPTNGATGNVVNVKELEVLQDYFASMRSNEWKERQTATQKLVDLVLRLSSKVPSSGKIVSIFDRLSERLSDGNQKVNVTALECCSRCIVSFGDSLEGSLPVLVPAICGNLARTPKLVSLAAEALEHLVERVDCRLLCQPFALQAEHGANVRIKASMMAKLVEITPRLFQVNKAALLSKFVVPLALRLLDESKIEIKAANNSLLSALYEAMGGKFIELVAHLNEEDMQKLNRALSAA